MADESMNCKTEKTNHNDFYALVIIIFSIHLITSILSWCTLIIKNDKSKNQNKTKQVKHLILIWQQK